ncbi:MAG: 30S ribosomal protein S19e [Methanobacteriota archaeon]
MTAIHDVPPETLIEKLAAELSSVPEIAAPAWAAFAKTGAHKERPPANRDWWTTRVAAVLRRVAIKGPIGIQRLRAEFGGRRSDGSAPEHARKGSGSVAREAVQQLEKVGLLENVKGRGRRVTPKGQKVLAKAAREAQQAVVAEIPALAKY